MGRELFPPLILIVALVLALEMLVANRFYKEYGHHSGRSQFAFLTDLTTDN